MPADGYLADVLLRTIGISGVAVFIALATGVPFGVWLALARFRGRRTLVALVHTGFALPPVVVGLFVYLLLSRQGPAGAVGLLFTPAAMVLAQALLAAPYVAGITLAAVQSVPADVRLQARALGASRVYALWTHAREARLGMGAAAAAAFGAIVSEVGAAMLVGGNILGETRVLSTAIMLETRRGNFTLALGFGLILLSLAFAANALITLLQQGRSAVERPSALGQRRAVE